MEDWARMPPQTARAMNETLLTYVADYGVAALALSCFLSCLLIPIPSSLMMLTGGAFVASGDLVAWQVIGAAWGGAVLGDQTGYQIGRHNADRLDRLAKNSAQRQKMLQNARELVARRGGLGVFFSTWAVAPLGPWVNFIAGAVGLGWRRFTVWDTLGEAIWVFGYTGLGYVFATNLTLIGELAEQVSGLVAAATVTLVLLILIVRRLQKGLGND